MNVVVLLINDRSENAGKVQSILTKNGDIIRTRLGINRGVGKADDEVSGFIFLELCGADARVKTLLDELNALDGVKAEGMKMELPSCACSCC
ncbi:MAG: hypothetical protein HPY50_18955 [Firmicutes bacterium]|nr:hypothetical protein [Bacillota bacterium]